MDISHKFDSSLAEEFYNRTLESLEDATVGDTLFTDVFWRFNDDLVIVREDGYGFVDAKRYESLEALDTKWSEVLGWVEQMYPDDAEMAFLEEAFTDLCGAMGIEIPDDELS